MFFKFLRLSFIPLAFMACKKATPTAMPDFPATEEAIANISGVVNVTYSSGGLAKYENKKPETFFSLAKSFLTPIDYAYAATACPTIQTGGVGCSNPTGAQESLVYSGCSFSGSSAVWNGTQDFTATGTTMTCGIFPTFAATNTLTRTFSAGTNRSLSSSGVVIYLETNGLSSGWSTPVATTGTSTVFSGAVARSITINGIRTMGYVGGQQFFDHTINSSAIAVNASNQVTSGTITVQHNFAHFVATASVTSALTFTAGCCYPTGGSLTTTFSDGASAQSVNFSATCGSVTINGVPTTLSQCF